MSQRMMRLHGSAGTRLGPNFSMTASGPSVVLQHVACPHSPGCSVNATHMAISRHLLHLPTAEEHSIVCRSGRGGSGGGRSSSSGGRSSSRSGRGSTGRGSSGRESSSSSGRGSGRGSNSSRDQAGSSNTSRDNSSSDSYSSYQAPYVEPETSGFASWESSSGRSDAGPSSPTNTDRSSRRGSSASRSSSSRGTSSQAGRGGAGRTDSRGRGGRGSSGSGSGRGSGGGWGKSSSSGTSGRQAPGGSSGAGDGSRADAYNGLMASGRWRVFQVIVPYATDPGKDDMSPSRALASAVGRRLCCLEPLPVEAIHLVRKSFDSRPSSRGMRSEKRWVYVVDIDAGAAQAAGANLDSLQVGPGQIEPVEVESPATMKMPVSHSTATAQRVSGATQAASDSSEGVDGRSTGQELVLPVSRSAHPVVVVGSGPAGLFAALAVARAGLPVLLLERGQPVEQRGRDIGALLVRGILNPDSNLCYGEGGAGTWSDGKLATKIGRNSDPVRAVLQALVDYGAPESILVAGKPHLGTDRLVMILKAMRGHLMDSLGAQIRFGVSVEDLEVSHGRVTGVKLAGTGEVIKASCVVLAVGHSARSMYRRLAAHDVSLTPKPFAMGFRVEHPQALIDTGRYGAEHAGQVLRGKGRIPVADYKLNVEVTDDTWSGDVRAPARTVQLPAGPWEAEGPQERRVTGQIGAGGAKVEEYGGGSGRAVPAGMRGVFSFCMCPGGQIVCTSTNPDQLCLNGMSFSRRSSVWANSALVVNVTPADWQHHVAAHGPLAGVAMQEEIERDAARRGGGDLKAPVQRVTDFLTGHISTGTLPSSSYRLGVRSAALHDLYPPFVGAALAKALERFERTIPGFMSSPDALLHGVETRTSAPLRIDRHPESLESVSITGLYPTGEGAGYAGGIVSAAVDGMRVGQAILQTLAPQAV